MSKFKKAFAAFITIFYIVGCLSGCTSGATGSEKNDKIKIIATIFPEYDWVRNVLGDRADRAELTLLLDNGVDLHSYQPTASDILKISGCDMFIYVGGESDNWVDDALKNATNKDMTVINLLETLGDSVKQEELVEGMQESEHHHGHEDHDDDHDHEDHDHEDHDDDHDHEDHDHEDHDDDHDNDHEDHDDDHDHEDHDHEDHDDEDEGHGHHHHDGEPENDEYVWLSLRNAGIFVNTVSEALQRLDPDNASSYQKNAEAYIKEFNSLDNEYKAAVDGASKKTLLFGDRFPFRYLTDDYGLNYYAAFIGCSADTEASFETIAFLAQKVDELSLNCVLTIEKSDGKIAKTVIESSSDSNRQILVLDSLQSVTKKDVESGATYLSIMENNLSVLKEALK